MYKKLKLLGLFALLASGTLHAQTENSPYSRYGIGDALPSQNIMLRGIGGVSAAYADLRSVNYTNPASYSKIKLATFDFGLEVDSRTLKVIDPPRKFNSVSPIISYIQLGLPLSKKHNWGMNLGLRPVTRINYSLERDERLPDIDSVHTLFQGNGGAYEVYTGTGISIKNFSIGFNFGYLFGTKDYTTERNFIPDSSFKFYYGSQYTTNSSFGGIFANAGIQYGFKIGKNDMLRFGAYGNLKRQYSASQDHTAITYQETESGIDTIDVVARSSESGKIIYPAKYGVGLMYFAGESWLLGADYEKTSWSQYRFFDQADLVQDSWMFHIGGQVIPNYVNPKSYWATVIYRGGFFYGKDYINVEKDLPVWGASLGMGLPMRRQNYSNQSSIINMTFEFGQRGNNANIIRENFFRVAVGLNLSDIWFIKRQYE
jgi:hypothetical protein